MKLTGVTPVLELTMAEEPGDREDAKLVLNLRPIVKPDGPGPHCGYYGRTHPPSGLEDMSDGGPPVHTCNDTGDCIAEYDRREPKLMDQQFPGWRKRYSQLQAAMFQARIKQELAVERQRLGAASQTAYGWYHPEEIARQQAQLDAEDRQFQALAREFAPPESFHDDLIAALAARRAPAAEVELAAEGQGIYGPGYDQGGPAPFAMLPGCGGPDGCDHITLRCPRNRGHLFGHMRGRDPRITDAATAQARRAVS